jgi:putative flippase GtrA
MTLLMQLRRSPLMAQFLSFAWVGAIATVAQYVILIGLVQFADARPAIASGLGYAAGATVNYLLNYHYTFASNRTHLQAVMKFMIVALIGLVVNSLIVAVATERLGLFYLLAQVIATGVVLLWNFTANRFWTFGSTGS